MVYRDITYCTSRRCENKGCTRKITEAMKAEAEEMGLPVSYADLRRVCSAFWDGDKRNQFGRKV